MEIEKEINKRKELQSLILKFIDEDNDENFQSLTKFINNNNISKTKIDLQDLSHILTEIANNYYRGNNFFSKIIKIVNFLLPDIRDFYTNQEIFNMFSQNKIIMLNLIQNNSIVLDKKMINTIGNFLYIYQRNFKRKNQMSFQPSNQKFLCPYTCIFLYYYYKSVNNTRKLKEIEELIKKEINMDIEPLQHLCQKGENDHYICQLIRQDMVNDFILYVNEKNVTLDSQIPFSAFETSKFLLDNYITLINYAAFYGSIQIFKYLLKSGANVDSTLLESAVHGRNAEIIHLIEENIDDSFIQDNDSFSFGIDKLKKDINGPVDALLESIKCFHNEIAGYFEQNCLDVNDKDKLSKFIIASGFVHYNYEFIPNEFDLLFPISKYQVDLYIPSIPEKAFKLFYIMNEVTIPPSITKIPDSCFKNMKNLNKVIISSSVTEIGVDSFYGCSSLAEVLYDGQPSLESIGKNAFTGCSSLKQLLILSSLKSIGDNAFDKCKSLSLISFEKNASLASIGKSAFANCTSISQILIPSSLKLIDENAFRNCKSLSTVSFEDPCSLTSIGKSAFAYCSSLASFTVPSSVTSIDDYAFDNCSSLKLITIPSSVTSIGDCSFNECTSLEQISIPNSVQSIGRCAFDSCSLLAQVSIPSSLKSISDYLFKNCSSLKQISLPSSLTSIGDFSFSKCTSLEQISIPSSVTSIGKGSFEQCTSLAQISIPSSVTSIGNNSFEGCSSLKQIEIPSSVASIGDYSFRKCISLEKVSFSSPGTKIGDFAFSGCKSLPKSSIPIDKKSLNDQNDKDEIHKYLQNRKDLYHSIFDFLDSSDEITDHLNEMIHKISEDEYDLIELLNLLSNLSIEATSTVIMKIRQILDVCKEKIQQKISINKLCIIFKRSLRILVYLVENKILKPDKTTFNIILNSRDDNHQDDDYNYYSSYDDNEIKMYIFFHPFIDKKSDHQKNDALIDKLERDKHIKIVGENTNEICTIIRNDSLDEFITHLNEMEKEKENENYHINNQTIPSSSYETNLFLFNVKYIHYAAFYGATKIFKYLFKKEFIDVDDDCKMNHDVLTNLWKYAIHGRQQEIIHILDKMDIRPLNEDQTNEHSFLNICFKMALRCHENEIARNLIKKQDVKTLNYLSAIKNFNFEFIEDFYNQFESNDSYLLFYACFYDYPKFAQLLITNRNIELDSFSNEHKLDVQRIFSYGYNQEKSDKCKIIDAAFNSKNEIIKFLIKTQKNIEFDGNYLVELMQCENYELLKIILSQPNIDVNQISYTSFTIDNSENLNHLSLLFLSILKRDIEFVKLLLNHPNIDVNKSFEPNTDRTTYRTALHIAIEMGYIQVVKLLLERPDIDVNAVANFDEVSFTFEYLIDRGHFDLYYTPLQEAVELNDIEVVKLLLEHPKIEVNKFGFYDTYDDTYKHKYKFDRVKQTVLCRAIQLQKYEIVKLLLQHPGIDVNKKAIFHQNETNQNLNYDDDIDEEEEERVDDDNKEVQEKNQNDEDSNLIVRRSPLQFAYAGKSEEIIQLLLNRNDIITTHTKENDTLIKVFTRGFYTGCMYEKEEEEEENVEDVEEEEEEEEEEEVEIE